jgi:hypothetical protein
MSKLRPKHRAIVAYHEASHAVAARVQGVGVDRIAMFPTDEGGTPAAATHSAAYLADKSDPAACITGREKDARVALAGNIGQQRARPGSVCADASDQEVARYAALCIALLSSGRPEPGPGEMIELSKTDVNSIDDIRRRLRSEAEALVMEHWSAIERVAQALLVRDLLLQDDIDRLISGRNF